MMIREHPVQGELERVRRIQMLEHDLTASRIQTFALAGNRQQRSGGETFAALRLPACLLIAQRGGCWMVGRDFYAHECRSIHREWEMLHLPFLRCFCGMEA